MCEWSAALIFTTSIQPFLTGVIIRNVKMSSECNCFSKLETDFSNGNVGIVQKYFET